MSLREAERRHVAAADGTRLHYREWAVDTPRGALLVLHGLFEHSRRYRELAGVMAAAGIATFALDLRGHGHSEGRRGHVPRFERFLDDVARFQDRVTASLPDVPRYLLGHSMGGLIALRYLEERDHGLAGAVISAPWLELAGGTARWQRMLAGALSRVLPTIRYPAGLDPEDLSHDPERVADYRDDPLIFSTLTPRLAHEVMKAATAAFDRADHLDVPLLFLLPGDDPIIDTPTSHALARSLRTGDVTIEVLDGYYHEALQETGRSAVLAQVRTWIADRLA